MTDTKQWYVYIVRCSDGTLYTGITPDIKRRVALHNSGKGAKYTRGRTPVVLVYSKRIGTKAEAGKAEYILRHKSRVDKEKMACYNKRTLTHA